MPLSRSKLGLTRENPRIPINRDSFYQTVYRRIASRRGILIAGLVTILFLKGHHSKVQNAAVALQITLTTPPRACVLAPPPVSRMASSKFFVPGKLFSETPVLSRLRGLNPFETKAPTMPVPVNNVSPLPLGVFQITYRSHDVSNTQKGDRVHVIVVFGRVNMGISSLVNLILGREDAPFNTDMHCCTVAPAAYRVDINGHAFDIYDIPGFGSDYAPEKTIGELYTERGIDLLIYCVRPKEGIARKIYNDVRSAVPERVPMVGVVTALEKYGETMEDWWSGPRKNGDMLASRGLKFVDHACVTTLSLEDVSYNMDLYERRYQSTQAVRNLIWRNCIGTKRVTYVESAPAQRALVRNRLKQTDVAMVDAKKVTLCHLLFDVVLTIPF